MREYFLISKSWVNTKPRTNLGATVILLISCCQASLWAFSTEIGVRNGLEYWQWNDSTGILENNTSLRWENNYLDVGAEVLYLGSFLENSSADSFQIKGDAGVKFHNFLFLAGDFYETIGNGLILGMEPIEEKKEERRIRGVKFDSDIKGVNLCGLWGVPYVIDRLQKKYRRLNDTNDVLMGLDFSLPNVSVRGLRVITDSAGDSTGEDKYIDLLGSELKFQTDLFSFDIEVVQKRGWDKSAFEEEDNKGVGSYITTTIGAPQNWVFNLQFMKYYNLAIVGYNCVPIVNRSGYLINEGKDESGFSVGVSKTIKNFVIDISHSRSKGAAPVKEIKETYMGCDFGDWKGTLKFLSLINYIESDFKDKREIGLDINGIIKNIEAELSLKKINGEGYSDTLLFYDRATSIGVSVRENFIVYTDYMWRSEEVIVETEGTEWYGLGVKCEFFGKMNLDVWGGKEKGGLLCSGGICRYIAPFEGFKVKLNVSF